MVKVDDAIQLEEDVTPDGIVIGFSQLGAESDWRTANTESMKAAFSEENGYELFFDDGQQKQENQIMAIRKFILQEVDYILLAPVKETGWETVLQEAKDAGIPVIIVDRMVDVADESLYVSWVGSDFELEGAKACEWLNTYTKVKNIPPEEIHIVNIQGTIGASAQIGRTASLETAARKNGWNLLAMKSGEYTQAKAREVMGSFLRKYDNINVVYCENDNEAFGAIEAIESAGRKVGSDIQNGEIMILSFDTTKAGLTDTLNGKIALDTECNPLLGPRVESMIQKIENGETIEKKVYVEENIFSTDKSVKMISIGNTGYPVTIITQDILDSRTY
ncbi:MAG: ABC transporter substrate-binding protein [Lachnospiraceae bacterium]|nr:ABC transporter substrate-binding protein [Lachnospiraceae bacterium]